MASIATILLTVTSIGISLGVAQLALQGFLRAVRIDAPRRQQ
jgi:hypothetical protein